jgi:hypothetical protein
MVVYTSLFIITNKGQVNRVMQMIFFLSFPNSLFGFYENLTKQEGRRIFCTRNVLWQFLTMKLGRKKKLIFFNHLLMYLAIYPNCFLLDLILESFWYIFINAIICYSLFSFKTWIQA